MKLQSDSGDFIQFDEVSAPEPTGDLLLQVQVLRQGFSGSVQAWVEQRVWFAFAQQLTVLEERRQGEAQVESMSPGEFSLVVHSVGRAGHMAVRGSIGYRSFDAEVDLHFSSFGFDPAQLPVLARDARDLSAQIGLRRG
jgi:hypothetical protein